MRTLLGAATLLHRNADLRARHQMAVATLVVGRHLTKPTTCGSGSRQWAAIRGGFLYAASRSGAAVFS